MRHASLCTVWLQHQGTTPEEHWLTLCLIKDALGSHTCFLHFDAALMETYDHFWPMVRARLFSPGSNLLMHRDLMQAFTVPAQDFYKKIFLKALICIFISCQVVRFFHNVHLHQFFWPLLSLMSPKDGVGSVLKWTKSFLGGLFFLNALWLVAVGW